MEKKEELYLAFQQWLHKKELTVSAFAKISGLSDATLYKAYKGHKTRIDTVRRIVKFTKKQLTLADFGY
jgi:predicted transcriptional regulator